MRKIFKYELAHTDVHIKHLPCDCTILSVQEQNGALVMWAEVDPDSEYIRMNIYIVGTGNPMPEGANTYIGTVQMSNGLVWHVFS